MRGSRRMLAVLITAGMLLAMAPGGAAGQAPGSAEPKAAPLGPDFYIGGAPSGTPDSEPAVVWNNTAREYLVVWGSGFSFPTPDMEIQGRRVSEAGAALAVDFVITGPLAVVNHSAPAVAWNQTTGEYLVIWSDDRHPSTRGSDIYGQRVSAAGERLGPNFRISGGQATAADAEPAVAWNADANEYLVVWEDRRNQYTSGPDIFGQRVSAAGDRLGPNFRISAAGTTMGESNPAMAWNSVADQYLVVWEDLRSRETRGVDIYGQLVTSGAKRLGGNFRISGTAALRNEATPQVAYDRDRNQYLVVWRDNRVAGPAAMDIYGRRVAANGKRLGADFRISGTAGPLDAYSPAAAWNAKTDEYLVVWRDRRNGAVSGYDVYGQEVSWGGALLGGNFRISGPGATSDDTCPALAYNPHLDQYLVVWQDHRYAGLSDDIWGRRVTG